jgi:hypothetical protein
MQRVPGLPGMRQANPPPLFFTARERRFPYFRFPKKRNGVPGGCQGLARKPHNPTFPQETGLAAPLGALKSIADLKGKPVSVDALTTGYAFVLLDFLKPAGLNQADYKIEKAGGVLARWEALKDRKYDVTMLITPFNTPSFRPIQ